MAPEVWSRAYGPMCDLWALGCVSYELLLGEPPFDPYKLPANDPETHLRRNVRTATYPTTQLQASPSPGTRSAEISRGQPRSAETARD